MAWNLAKKSVGLLPGSERLGKHATPYEFHETAFAP